MIDINELRFSAANSVRDLALLPSEVTELLDRLEAAEKDAAHQKALAESALRVAEGWEIKCGELRAKIEHMENQEPVGYGVLYVEPATGEEDWDSIWKYQEFAEDHIKDFTQAYADIGEPVGEITTVPLYALPGAQAQPAPSVPEDIIRDAVRYRFLRAAKNIPISSKAARDPVVYDEAIDAAMLAAAPETKRDAP